MGKSSAQNPPTPDPNALINAQSNANRINQLGMLKDECKWLTKKEIQYGKVKSTNSSNT